MANPFGPASVNIEKVDIGPMLVIVGECELLKDRGHDYATRLKEMGKKVEYVEIKGKQHGHFTNDPYSETSHDIINIINRFMIEN
ncbi:Probable carboxylesterase 15 [Linum perenne]